MLETLLFVSVLMFVFIMSGLPVYVAVMPFIVAIFYGAFALIKVLFELKGTDKRWWSKAIVMVMAGLFMLGYCKYNNFRAIKGALTIGVACEMYKTDHHKYPESLNQLVPTYMPKIPKAKSAILHSGYTFENGQISYEFEPGMLTNSFDLATQQWHIKAMVEKR